MIKKWVLFGGCITLLLGSLMGALVTRQERSEQLRGWESATQTLELPYRLPIAGVNVELTQYTAEELDHELDRIAAAGFTWVRQTFLWEEVEPEAGQFEWDTYDAIVEAVGQHEGLQLVAVLDGTPAWARHRLTPNHPFAPPSSVATYANFAREAATRYGDSIDYYQIWDEPNIRSHWGGMDPNPAHYVAMLREAYQAIHAADGTSSVITAALAPTVETGPENLNELQYLQAIYKLGGKDYFDAAAGKPYGFDLGPADRQVEADVMNFARWILLREEMVRQGDGKKPLWGSNFGWNYLPDDWSGPPSIWGSVSAEAQEQYTREAYQRASQEWPWTGGLILQHWQPDAPADDPMQGFAVSKVIEQWLAHGALVSVDRMTAGLYPAQNDYTVYSENWQLGELGADAIVREGDTGNTSAENRIEIQFEGTSFAIPVRRDDYLAYLYIKVDGKQAPDLPRDRQGDAYIILTSPNRTPEIDRIVVAKNLEDGPHTVEIIHRPYHGDDRWPIAGYAVGYTPDTSRYSRALIACGIVGGLALLGAAVVGWRLNWKKIKPPSSQTLRQAVEWMVGLAASFVVLLGALLTWGDGVTGLLRRDPPALAFTIMTAGIASLSPVFVLTLAALAVLFILIYNRPLLGVMLIIFWSAFYLTNMDLLVRLFATVEVYFVLTALALVMRGSVTWAKAHQAGGKPIRADVRLNGLDWAGGAFVVVAVVSLAWADFWSPAIRQLRVVILEPAAFYVLLRMMHMERRDWLWLVDTLLFTGGAIAVVGIIMFFTGEGVVEAENGVRRLISVYGSPNGVGLYLGRCLPFALACLILPMGTWRKLYAGAAGVVMMAAVLLSQSRGAILLGIPAAILVIVVFWRGRRAVIPVAVGAVALGLAFIPLSLLFPRLSDLFGNTAFFREHLWYSSVNLIRERPFTGAGLDQFLYWYRSRYLLPEAWAEPNLSIPHNILLNHWVNLGILGVAAAILVQVLFWRKLWKVQQQTAGVDWVVWMIVLGLAGSMADFLAHGLVDVAYFSINLAFVFFLSLALLQQIADPDSG